MAVLENTIRHSDQRNIGTQETGTGVIAFRTSRFQINVLWRNIYLFLQSTQTSIVILFRSTNRMYQWKCPWYTLTFIWGPTYRHTFRIWGLFDPKDLSVVIYNGRNKTVFFQTISVLVRNTLNIMVNVKPALKWLTVTSLRGQKIWGAMCKINYSLAPPYKSIVSNSLGMLRVLGPL